MDGETLAAGWFVGHDAAAVDHADDARHLHAAGGADRFSNTTRGCELDAQGEFATRRNGTNIFRRVFSLSLKLLAALALLAAVTARADAPAQSAELAAKKTDDGILFQCSAPGATAVYLAGDFNSWAEANNGVISDEKYKMSGPDSDGLWRKTVTLTPGVHKFKFSIGGTAEGWFAPEWAAKDSEGNGLITVAEDGAVSTHAPTSAAVTPEEKSADASGAKTTFTVTAPDATTVYLAGDFNGWGDNKDGVVADAKYAMIKGEDGIWKTVVALPAGKHAYKFVVDGNKWEADPTAPDKDADGNSVVR